MYLRGEKYFTILGRKRKTEDGFEVSEHILDLGKWRKHPDLHGLIVKQFADGKDNCQRIYLDADGMSQIIGAIKQKHLPKTTGPFFGESEINARQTEADVKTFMQAIDWLLTYEFGVYKAVYYEASW